MTATSAPEHRNRDKLRQLYSVLRTGDVDRLDEIMAPDCITEYVQSGERVVGLDNIKALIAHYPGGHIETDPDASIFGEEEHYMLTSTFNVVRVQGGGDTLVGTSRTRYPDGSIWHIVSIVQFRDGLIAHAQQFFAPEFEAPAWRAQWVERIPAARPGD